ncbi:MAG: 2-succinyl-5-enolpyruvyl-6-hydroxy-3-cyclohexene-1-carboxylic-acid synthase, partial [Flavobacteriaceae bacterium]|nr:2-succinyl-5-enolpyruvyl-6-hydroxy-3-cyclohexene-1-carboxylic-acid synthase [Flavobacteriaceae bacterium]
MKFSNIPTAYLFMQLAKQNEITDVVISPGSRNAPLALSFTLNNNFNAYSIVDERAAGFFALGIAKKKKKPVILICTSGSALLNYYPAVAEAYYSQIPLIVASADRPSYKIDIGDGQTIQQNGVFNKLVAFCEALEQDVCHATNEIELFAPHLLTKSQEEIESFNNKAIQKAISLSYSKQLPVHLNFPFEESLYGISENPPSIIPEPTATTYESDLQSFEISSKIRESWKSYKKKMIIIGGWQPTKIEKQLLFELTDDESILVFSETTSNCFHDNFINSIDSIIAPIEKSIYVEEQFKDLQPELILTIGGQIVSKKIKTFLRRYKALEHWHLGKNKALNTFYCLTSHLNCTPEYFFKAMIAEVRCKNDYRGFWLEKKNTFLAKREDYISKIPFSDFWVFYTLQKNLPSAIDLHLANSSSVRYSQLMPLNKTCVVYSNRGTSGIEGSTSTAIGGHQADPDKFVVLITGDLSFFYDINALWSNYIKSNFRIILLNNKGGGIFRILPG